MIKNRKFKKKEKKGVFRYENYFESYFDSGWKAPNKEVPKKALYRWAKKRVKYFKKDQNRRKNRYFEGLKKRVKKNNFFLIYFKTHILFCIYLAVPLSFLLVAFNWYFYTNPKCVMSCLEYWNKNFSQYGCVISFNDFVLFMLYYLSPMVIVLKILFFPPIFLSHLFVIWYVHINTKWNDYMERKLISIAVWRLGVGYLPASAEIVNSWIFWGEAYYVAFYKNTFITAPFFVVKQIWKFFGTFFNTVTKTIITFIFNIFK